MRFNLLTLTALLPLAGVVAGCGIGPQMASTVAPDGASRTVTGRAFGGQQPIAHASVYMYTYGTTGYGSTGTQLLPTTTTDANGNFSFNLNCTAAQFYQPVYMLVLGGQPITGQSNSNIALAAGFGSCANAENSYINVNEVSTAVLAFALSHFFSSTNNDGITSDHFGSPADLQNAISRVNDVLIPTLLDIKNGVPNASSNTITIEAQKILTIADILGACVNSASSSSSLSYGCQTLFTYTATGGVTPANTLEAAINMSLHPTQNVTGLFGLVPSGSTSAFAGALATAPNDWTLAVTYRNPALGLGVNPSTVTTLDIDTNGRVWFPTNLPGAAGVAYFDPNTSSFSQAYVATGMVRPEQVAIDNNGTVWASDVSSPVAAGFPSALPTLPIVLQIPGTTSTALTIDSDNSVRTTIVTNSTNEPSFGAITGPNNNTGLLYTYAPVPNTTPNNSQNFIGASVAGNVGGANAVSATNIATPYIVDFYYYANGTYTDVITDAGQDSGQVIVGINGGFVNTRGGYSAATDGICVFAQATCYSMSNQAADRHPSGLAIDGVGALWVADTFTPDVQKVPYNNQSYLDSNGMANNQVYPHGTGNGGTMTTLGGIGIDGTGNVWTTNIGCTGIGCTPGTFALTEVIGAGAPTINPIANQVFNYLPGEKPSLETSTGARR